MNKEKTILGVGSIALDTIETKFGKKNNIIGGSLSYFSISASKSSFVKIVGVIGNDFPNSGIKMFKNNNINIDNLNIVNGNTFRWGGKYSDDFNTRDTLFTELGVFESFSPEINDNDRDAPLLFLGNIQPSLQLSVCDMMINTEYIVTDTMNLWIDLFPQELEKVINKSNILLINHEESEQLSGIKDIEKAAKYFLEMGPNIVVIKIGANGSYLAQKKSNSSYIPVFPIKQVIDPTGAGDTFAGGFLGYLSKNPNPNFIDAVITGSAMASFCVEGFGLDVLLSASNSDINNRIQYINNKMIRNQ
tara:strand:- start:2103 stop:3014 length:912 start_codon:yes stop_codon:yes gene_type:complete